MLFDLENELVDANIKDCFEGTSVSSISTQPFGKNLLCVADVKERKEKKDTDILETNRSYNVQIQNVLIKIFEHVFPDNLEEIKKNNLKTDI